MANEGDVNDTTCAVGLGCALEAFTEVDEVKGMLTHDFEHLYFPNKERDFTVYTANGVVFQIS